MMARALAIGLCGTVFCAWNRWITGHFSMGAIALFVALVWVAYRWGTRLAARSRLALGLPFTLLLGTLAVNTALFAVRCVCTLPMPAYLAVIGLLALVDWFLPRPTADSAGRDSTAATAHGQLAELLAVVVSLAGATAWSRDALNPMTCREQVCHFRVWDDAFIHARLVAQIAAPRVPIQNRRTAGQSAPMYHYASYVLPAVLTSVSPTSPYQAYLGFLTPLSLVLAAWAAYCLGAYLGGPWAGLAACLAILLPDPAFQGTGNFYLSYHWLTQISHGLNFGIALSVLAWLAMFAACRSGRWRLLLLSYAIMGLCLVYKAHLLVANALPLAVYPALFFRGVPWPRRIVWATLVVTALAGVAQLSRSNARLPQVAFGEPLRREYLKELIRLTENTRLQAALPRFEGHDPAWREIAKGALVLSVCTLGLWAVAAMVVLPFALRRGPAWSWAFPLVVTVNYLMLALGLSANESPLGTRDEFLHRPFTWAYFVLATWTAAYATASLGRRRAAGELPADQNRHWRPSVVGLLVGLTLAVPPMDFFLSHGLQRKTTFPSDRQLPLGLVQCCEFVRTDSQADDVVQDTQGNQCFAVSGLCARQIFISCDDLLRAKNAAYVDRLKGLDAWQKASAEERVLAYARQERIRYLIAHPNDLPTWPPTVAHHPVFSAGGFRVYRFSW